MKKELMFKAFSMIFLILTMPFTIPVALADDDMLAPGDQCMAKAEKSDALVDLMDNGVINTLEMVAALMLAIATLVNTIDTIITAISSVIGLFEGLCCPSAAFGPEGIALCKEQEIQFDTWQKIKRTGIMDFITAQATCACCSGKRAKAGANTLAKAGTNFGVCPLGDITEGFGGMFGMESNTVSKDEDAPERGSRAALFSDNSDQYYNKFGSSYKGTGISKFHFSAFDNIYVAVGCMCPVAILFNLRKLKTIYQVHNCCVKEACRNGMSTEACERQFDEASCMYWEGSIMKTALLMLASFFTGWIAAKITQKLMEWNLASCVLLFLEIAELPARMQAVMGSYDWLSTTFSEPACEDLGFEDIEEMLESGFDSQSAGMRYIMLDSNYDGRMDSVAEEGSEPTRSVQAADTTKIYTYSDMEYKIVKNDKVVYREQDSNDGWMDSAWSPEDLTKIGSKFKLSDKTTSDAKESQEAVISEMTDQSLLDKIKEQNNQLSGLYSKLSKS
ncbi:hypothetical protein GF323_00495, partial [Candidatus Woesearchaeota archaeon]|nr:hypothetical protein [Candidatus Woesearchaeota archaeon]